MRIDKLSENVFRKSALAGLVALGAVAGTNLPAKADFISNDASDITSHEDLTTHTEKMSALGRVAILVQSENEDIRFAAEAGARYLIKYRDSKNLGIDIVVINAKNLEEGHPDSLSYYVNGLRGNVSYIEKYDDTNDQAKKELAKDIVYTAKDAVERYEKVYGTLGNGSIAPASYTPND